MNTWIDAVGDRRPPCPKCGHPMTILLVSAVCDWCNPPGSGAAVAQPQPASGAGYPIDGAMGDFGIPQIVAATGNLAVPVRVYGISDTHGVGAWVCPCHEQALAAALGHALACRAKGSGAHQVGFSRTVRQHVSPAKLATILKDVFGVP